HLVRPGTQTSAVIVFVATSTMDTVTGSLVFGSGTFAAKSIFFEWLKASPLGLPPTLIFCKLWSFPWLKTPTVFSPRLDVNTRSFSFETRTPATPARFGIDLRYLS